MVMLIMIMTVMLTVITLFLYLTTYFCLLFCRLNVEHSSLHIYILVIALKLTDILEG